MISTDVNELSLTSEEIKSFSQSFLASFVANVAKFDATTTTATTTTLTTSTATLPDAASDFAFLSSTTNSPVQVTIKFDSACSRNMSGVPDRLQSSTTPADDIGIKGFNNSISYAKSIGLNSDNKTELYVPSMPSNLVLLSAHDYAKDGCALLFENFGLLLKLTPQEKNSLLSTIAYKYPVDKVLTVTNNTYEVLQTPHASISNISSTDIAHSSTASRFFNSKINITNPEERVLAMLLTGLSFQDIYSHLKNNSIEGLPRDLTIQSMNRFEHKFGRTPEVIQLALPNLAGNTKGYMAPPAPLTHVGQRVEADYFFCEINEQSIDPTASTITNPNDKPVKTRTQKLPTHGGGIAGFVAIDAYSGYVHGQLAKSLSKSLDRVKHVHRHYLTHGKTIENFAADIGILSESKFRVMMPDVQGYFSTNHIKTECGEAYNHNNGTSHVEEIIKQIQQLICFAFLYILHNPNFNKIGFTRIQILKLWGEIFYWSITVINLKPSPNDPMKSRFELFYNLKPDLRTIRLFPIFAVVYVLRRKDNELLTSKKYFWQRGLYVGPSPTVRGCIRVVVRTNNTIQIITSSCIKCVTDGGDINQTNELASQHIFNLLDNTVDFTNLTDPTTTQSSNPLKFMDSIGFPDDQLLVSPDIPNVFIPPSQLRGDDNTITTTASPGNSQTSQPLVSSLPDQAPIFSLTDEPTFNSLDSDPTLSGPSNELRGDDNSSESTTSRDNTSPIVTINKSTKKKKNKKRKSKTSITTNNVTPETTENKSDDNTNTIKAIPIELKQQKLNYEKKVETLLQNFSKLSRQERANLRNMKKDNIRFEDPKLSLLANTIGRVTEECQFVDFSTHDDDDYYFSFGLNAYIKINGDTTNTNYNEIKEHFKDIFSRDDEDDDYLQAFRAVTENVPRNFSKALVDSTWGSPARKELGILTDETKCLVKIPRDLAQKHIDAGAEVLYLIPVYEEKVKEGKLVRKVRLVADGRTNKIFGSTYSPTPTKEELFILLHIFASLDYDFWHIDEDRAFLNAKKQDKNVRLAKFRGSSDFFEILGALYGTKDASRDYDESSAKKLLSFGFTRLHLCSCIFYKCEERYNYFTKKNEKFFIFIYKFVDDYIIGGNSNDVTLDFINEFRCTVNTTEPIKNPTEVLGMELNRDKDRKIIKVTMKKKISEVVTKYQDKLKKRNIPLPSDCYIIHDHEFEALHEEKSCFLDASDRELYMTLVGILIWIQGCRLDIIFAVLYLSWSTKNPRQHHLNMAYYVIGYLQNTIDIPLVLGGSIDLQATTFSDASLGTGPKGRTVIGTINKLNLKSGAVSAKSSATPAVNLSSFEGELEGITVNFKSLNRIINILIELNIELLYLNSEELETHFNLQGQSYSDNLAMINFVKGEGVAKGVRHMALRMWYTRTEYQKGKFRLDHMSGKEIPADYLTKPSCLSSHRKFTADIMGLELTGLNYYPT